MLAIRAPKSGTCLLQSAIVKLENLQINEIEKFSTVHFRIWLVWHGQVTKAVFWSPAWIDGWGIQLCWGQASPAGSFGWTRMRSQWFPLTVHETSSSTITRTIAKLSLVVTSTDRPFRVSSFKDRLSRRNSANHSNVARSSWKCKITKLPKAACSHSMFKPLHSCKTSWEARF